MEAKKLQEIFWQTCKEWNDRPGDTGGGYYGIWSDPQMGTVDGHLDDSFFDLFLEKLNEG